ncbi:hypothetical protein EYF80_058011 [Liparis tanakae]|uniref:Uncharacterized protein n=1 Tax=Liparis tanakae TaxID=230148 RepID=A0A4Z2ESP1_9TELE|nr:hypothetical protein EYF80_058011 [Liparis tanakae]
MRDGVRKRRIKSELRAPEPAACSRSIAPRVTHIAPRLRPRRLPLSTAERLPPDALAVCIVAMTRMNYAERRNIWLRRERFHGETESFRDDERQ